VPALAAGVSGVPWRACTRRACSRGWIAVPASARCNSTVKQPVCSRSDPIGSERLQTAWRKVDLGLRRAAQHGAQLAASRA